MKLNVILVKHIQLLACGNNKENLCLFYFIPLKIVIDVFDVSIMICVKPVFLRVIMQNIMMDLIQLKNIVNKYELRIEEFLKKKQTILYMI